jgi:hypothetical protein
VVEISHDLYDICFVLVALVGGFHFVQKKKKVNKDFPATF